MIEYQGQYYEYDLDLNLKGAVRFIRNYSDYWRKRGYNPKDRIGFPTGVKPEHVQRAEQGVQRARVRLAKTSVSAAANARGMKSRGWKLTFEENMSVLRHPAGIVYAWEGDVYAQKKGGRVKKFASPKEAIAFIEAPTVPRKRTPAKPPAPVKKATTGVKRTTTQPRASTWSRGSGQGGSSWNHPAYGSIRRMERDRNTERPYKTSDGRRFATLADAKAHLQARKAAKPAQKPAAPRKAPAARKTTQTAPPAAQTAPAPAKRTRKTASSATAEPGTAVARRGSGSAVEYREPPTNVLEGTVMDRGAPLPARRRERGGLTEAEVQEARFIEEETPPRATPAAIPPMIPNMTFQQWSRSIGTQEPFKNMSAAARKRAWASQMGLDQEHDILHPSALAAPVQQRPDPPTDPRGAKGIIQANNRVIDDLQRQLDEMLESPRSAGGALQATYRSIRRRMLENRAAARGAEGAGNKPREPFMREQYWLDRLEALDEMVAQFDLRQIENRLRGGGGSAAMPRGREKSLALSFIHRVAIGAEHKDSEDEYNFALMVEGKTEFKGYGGNAHTGTMIALVPSDEMAEELALDGGEKAHELHTTLMFLGPASRYDAYTRERIVQAVRNATLGMPRVRGKAFAASAFNPKGKDPCVVLGVGGKELTTAHGVVEDAVREGAMVMPPSDQHSPWVPHITLAYTDNPSKVLKRAMELADGREVVFDRIRVSFGDDEMVDLKLHGFEPPSLVTRLKLMKRGAADNTVEQLDEGSIDTGRLNHPRSGNRSSFGGLFVPGG